ncbi:MAG: phosphoenolpyruvate carboxylase [Candidatus Helarchaeota archaeon]
MPKIPRCMSTQHPDNVRPPFFADNPVLEGDSEIQEAFYSYSHLGCDEQMWDCEGKEVDNFVVKKLLSKYKFFFREHQLGRDIFLTLRVPNPAIEKAEAKILLETLESIPRSFDAARLFYDSDVPPIFEIILPMTTSYKELDRIYRYYHNFIIGRQNLPLKEGEITVAQWIGEFEPEKINIIPLYEDMKSMLNAHNITKKYLEDKDVMYQRVFLARSDPAMNYGLITAVLLNKIALQRLNRLSDEIGIKIFPIIGVGSAPFRGNLKPKTVKRVVKEYPSIFTFTIQSSFKYDNPIDEVIEAIKFLHNNKTLSPQKIDEEFCLDLIKRYCKEYQKQIIELSSIINDLAQYIPNRRARKLHIGLFGYSRSMEGIQLPRAIKFTASLYSIGLPPEILGLNVLNSADLQFLRKNYLNFETDLNEALRFFNPDSNLIPAELKQWLRNYPFYYQIDMEYKEITSEIISALRKNNTQILKEFILQAANIRGFLG